MKSWRDFAEVWAVDFEFGGIDGLPDIRCMVARELHSNRLTRLWVDELRQLDRAPFETGSDSLVVAHYATAELGCLLALEWPLPANLVDTFVEARRKTNGLYGADRSDAPTGYSLLDVAMGFGVPAIEVTEKGRMRDLALRGGSYSVAERAALLDYCQTDVDTLARIVPPLLDGVDLTLSLAVDQHYISAVAEIERRGVPLDVPLLHRFQAAMPAIKRVLPTTVDPSRLIYRPDGTFSSTGWIAYLDAHRIPVPMLPSGKPDLEDDTLRLLAKAYPAIVGPIRECRYVLCELKLDRIVVGPDGRNHCLLSMYRSVTGRNQPSNAKFVFGPARWVRSLIRPAPGWAVVYLDWQAQEYGVMAALSGDPGMTADCAQDDPYIASAVRAGLAPLGATKRSHPEIRARWKVVGGLAVPYGMGPDTLSVQLGVPLEEARRLLQLHRDVYPAYWRWSDGAMRQLFGSGHLWTPYGWMLHAHDRTKATTGMNFPVQATGAEMMRIAAALGVANGVRICAPVHDAFLIEAPVEEIHRDCQRMIACMELASRKVLGGFTVRVPFTESDIVAYPERYRDEKDDERQGGAGFWRKMVDLLDMLDRGRMGQLLSHA